MKKGLTIIFTLITMSIFAQTQDHNSVSGGILAGANVYHFSVKDFSALDYKSQWGLDAGAWFNIPLGKVVSIEPQLMYSGRKFTPEQTNSTAPQGKLNFFSVPLFLKVGLGKSFAIMAGPQFDFLLSTKDSRNVFKKDDWRKSTTSITAGIEVMPHARLTGYLRGNWGTKDMFKFDDNNTAINPKPEYKMVGFHFGLKLKLFGHHALAVAPLVAAAVVMAAPVDTDGDGVNDADDKCPNVSGVAKYNGCPIPDTDGDGINDEQDKCATVAGLAKYDGCPIPDTDADGINDEEDKCATVAGLAKYSGCPIPDTDGDSVNDEDDKCINTAGLPENKGCPEMVFYYKRADVVLDKNDKAELDKLVAWMGSHPDLNISIEGHTSTLGATDYNQKLSQQRANSCVTYLISKGIDSSRLKAVGFGEQFPIGDNSTEEGRAKSRRVVMRIAD